MSDYIPEDNLVQILKNLPVKSLLRFRCVSRRWKDVIDSPSFLQEHLSVQNPRILIHGIDIPQLLVVDPHTLSTLPLGRFPDRDLDGDRLCWANKVRYFVCGALHGIVCFYDYGRDLLLWNPAIRKFSVLPLPDITPNFAWNVGCLTQGCVGFWIDPSNKEYKFISFTFKLGGVYDRSEKRDVLGVLYSSIRNDWRVIPIEEEGKWKPLQQSPTDMVGRVRNWVPGIHPTLPIMIERVSYWKGTYLSENEQGHHHNPVGVMLSFDFVLEGFEFLEMPFPSSSELLRSIPFQLQGTISLLYYRCWDETDSRRIDIYSRQGDSWVHMFDFDLRFRIYKAYWAMGETEDNFRILAGTEDGTVLYDTRAGCTPLMGEYSSWNKTCVAHESLLLFPTSVNPSITR